MTTSQMKPSAGQPNHSEVSILGILFFLMGAPHLYGALKHRAKRPKRFNPTPYATAVLLASAIAGVVELSIL